MPDESVIGRYARIVVESGTNPLRKGLKLACRITGVTTPAPNSKSALRGEVVSNDLDGPYPTSMLEGFLVIAPIDRDLSEAGMLERGSFRASVSLLDPLGKVIARGKGSLLRLSDEIPYEGLCPACQGWKICEDCAGTGGGPHAICAYCHGSGRCSLCEGAGTVSESDEGRSPLVH